MVENERRSEAAVRVERALWDQLNLLCKRSKMAEDYDLPHLTEAMIEVINRLVGRS